MPESRVATIEGQRTFVVERRPPLQPKLDGLIGALVPTTYRADFGLTGAALSCSLRDHRFRRFREGRHVGLDGVVRDLALQMCTDCGAVCVRDVSFDRLPGLRIGRGGPRRRDLVLGWYSGARPNQREYR
jgi:hypothetical protein